jgi:uncharacterized SAM-binding protein YcdF (DUF218 family)
MSLLLSKLVSLLVQPLPLALLFLLSGLGIAPWWQRIGWGLMVAGVGVLWLFATPLVAHRLEASLEARFPPESAASVDSVEAIVVLGGAIRAARAPRIHPDLSAAADRVWHAARLYHAGRATRIIASGGTMPWRDSTQAEAPAVLDVLADFGVPREAVTLESGSATTYENARNTARICRQNGIERIALVTSALHMRRALATFRTTPLDVVPAATDYNALGDTVGPLDVAPTAGALSASRWALHEYVGYVVYRWRGWIG